MPRATATTAKKENETNTRENDRRREIKRENQVEEFVRERSLDGAAVAGRVNSRVDPYSA